MASKDFSSITLNNFTWFNEPTNWDLCDNVLNVTTNNKTDFWQGTWYNFYYNNGHLFGTDVKDDFTFEACVEGTFTTLYDQAGLMIYIDEKHWLKTGIEFNDGQPMISSVLTNEVSDWGTGIFPGDSSKFWIRLSSVQNTVCVKYSVDKVKWYLLRLCPFTKPEGKCFVGFMCCSPSREGFKVKFSDFKMSSPSNDIVHGN